MFQGRPLSGPHSGDTGIFLKAAALQGGYQVTESILYRLDRPFNGVPFSQYVGTETDFAEFEELDMELVVTPKEAK